VSETFHEIVTILRDVFVNEDSVHRVVKTALGRFTVLVCVLVTSRFV